MTGAYHVQPNQVHVFHRGLRGGSVDLAGDVDRGMGIPLVDLADRHANPNAFADFDPDRDTDFNVYGYLHPIADCHANYSANRHFH